MPTPAGCTAGAAAASSSSSRTGADEAPPRGRARALGPQEVAAKVAEYEAFANDVLKVRLDAITARRKKLQSEADEFGELARTVTSMHEEGTTELKALVELGAGVHCRARVPDAARVCVSVGLGFHLECTLPEAAIIASNRQRALQAKADECVAEAAQVKAHLRFVAQALGELQQLGR